MNIIKKYTHSLHIKDIKSSGLKLIKSSFSSLRQVLTPNKFVEPRIYTSNLKCKIIKHFYSNIPELEDDDDDDNDDDDDDDDNDDDEEEEEDEDEDQDNNEDEDENEEDDEEEGEEENEDENENNNNEEEEENEDEYENDEEYNEDHEDFEDYDYEEYGEHSPHVHRVISKEQLNQKVSFFIPKIGIGLKDYQKEGIIQLIKLLMSKNKAALLADDMGLGKTRQAAYVIKFFIDNKISHGKFFIVVPKTLIPVWINEIKLCDPKLGVHIYHGQKKTLNTENNIIITTYSTAALNVEELNKIEYELLILDEAHEIRNPATRTTKAIKSLKAKKRLAITGTPYINQFLDTISIFDFLKEGYLDEYLSYEEEEYYENYKLCKKIRKKLSKMMIRRFKNKETIYLPPIIYTPVDCNFTREQTYLYKKLTKNLNKKYKTTKYLPSENYKILFKEKLHHYAQQICHHPSLFKSKKKRKELGCAIPVFSKHQLGSGKLLSIKGFISTLPKHEKVVIFSSSKKLIEIGQKILSNMLNEKVLTITGSNSAKERKDTVDEFQNENSSRILLISIKAGGTGLTLTKATHVIHHDACWTLLWLNQASTRAHRWGQKQRVFVYYLRYKNGYDKSIYDRIKEKYRTFELYFGTPPSKVISRKRFNIIKNLFEEYDILHTKLPPLLSNAII